MDMKVSKRFFIMILAVVLCSSYLLASCLVAVKIKNDIFKYKNVQGADFTPSYKTISISGEDIAFKLYQIGNNNGKETIFYIPSRNGILDSTVNSLVLKYNVFALEYPYDSKDQNVTSLLKRISLAFKYLDTEFGIKSKDVILFGHEIGANIAFEFSQNLKFKSVILLNQIISPRAHCIEKFIPFFCIFTSKNLFSSRSNVNPVYLFFNDTDLITTEDRYNIFNAINAEEKFFFEIPGNSVNFNFDHILEFYLNENSIQIEKTIDTQSINEEDEIENDESSVLDADGLLNEEKYVD